MDKKPYIEFCNNTPEIPLFSRPWWLDIVCGESNWDIIYETENNTIVAFLPYFRISKLGFNYLLMPPFTQYLGVWIKYKANQNYSKRLSYEKKLITQLIKKLPRFDRFNQSFHPGFKNWLPFYWHGFNQKNNISYVINNISEPEKVYSNISSNIRGDIKKARSKLNVNTQGSVDDLIGLMLKSRNKQVAEKLVKNSLEKGVGKVFVARDEKGNLHAAAFFLEDHDMIHYLIGSGSEEYRRSGASSLLIWSAIELYSSSGKKFNFEGSMVSSIEKYFRGFGGEQVIIPHIYKIPSKILRLKEVLTK